MPCLKNILFFILIALFLVTSSFSQNKETGISIIVKDQFDATIPNAEITLNKSGENFKQSVTNELGVAEFFKIPAGEYKVSVTAKGFKDYEKQHRK